MEVTGKLINTSIDWQTQKFNVTFEINESETFKSEVESISDCEKLSIKAVKFRNRRSLDANALLWKCLGDIAVALKTDKWEVYLQMLRRYGKFSHIIVKENAVEAVKRQWRECEVVGDITVNGQKAVQMLCYFGSSTYDTKEFSTLLDGVISEMQEMGLETPMTADMERALEMWGKRGAENGKQTHAV